MTRVTCGRVGHALVVELRGQTGVTQRVPVPQDRGPALVVGQELEGVDTGHGPRLAALSRWREALRADLRDGLA